MGRIVGESTPVVFILDDEPLILSTLVLILDRAGFGARAFASPLKAIEAAEIQTPDILITDVLLPEMNGIDLAIHFEKHFPECKILLISGQVATGDLLEASYAQGRRFDVLPKPFHPVDLLATLDRL